MVARNGSYRAISRRKIVRRPAMLREAIFSVALRVDSWRFWRVMFPHWKRHGTRVFVPGGDCRRPAAILDKLGASR